MSDEHPVSEAAKKDLGKAQWIFGLLGLAGVLIGLKTLWGQECAPASDQLAVMCRGFGSTISGLIAIALGTYLIWMPFSKQGKQRLLEKAGKPARMKDFL